MINIMCELFQVLQVFVKFSFNLQGRNSGSKPELKILAKIAVFI